ncbi:hypothetical protein D3C81_1539570 [compost metagenome]
MVVAGPGELQAIRGARAEGWRSVLADHHQRFQCLGDALVRKTVVTMATLDVQTHQRQFLEPGQVGAGRGRADLGNARQLSAGAGVAVHQRAQDFCPGRLGNRGGDLRDADVMLLCVRYAHISLPDESSPCRTAENSNTFHDE